MIQLRLLILTLILIGFNLPAQAQFGKLLDKAKEAVGIEDNDIDIAGGLKEALENGVGEAVDNLSEENGYFESPYKILIPEDAQKVISVVKRVPGFENVERDLIQKMNQAAEIAAKEATPIFVNAIKNMSFNDAKEILFGDNDAATVYLEDQSRNALYDKFMPVIQSSLDEVNARSYWKSVVNEYNKVPFIKKMNPELDDHVNNKALDGMFGLIEVKEQKIRKDVDERTSPLLKDVFGQLDN